MNLASTTLVMVRSRNTTRVENPTSIGEDPHIKAMASLTKGIMAVIVILTLFQLATLVVLFSLLRKNAARRIDEEQGIELRDRSMSIPSSSQVQANRYDCVLGGSRAPQSGANPFVQLQERETGGPYQTKIGDYVESCDSIQGPRPLSPAYNANVQSQAHPSRTPVGTFTRQQTYGTDYSSGGRPISFWD